jgi:fluoroquinolone resistance protein
LAPGNFFRIIAGGIKFAHFFAKKLVNYGQILNVMNRPSFYAETFRATPAGWSFGKGEYEDCVFNNIQQADADLSGCIFINCRFHDCDFSMANIDNTAFRAVQFIGCKLIGVRFDAANPLFFEASFTDCQLRLATFYGWKMPEAIFKNCGLQEVDFAEANLKGATIRGCDLSGAMFERTNLAQVDFRESFHFAIDPENNKVQHAKFSKEAIEGLLGKYNLTIE